MKILFDSVKPVYLQIAEAIEDDILYGKLLEGENCYSQLVVAKELKVNPATAAKGIQVLVQKGILTKQRGQSMVVAEGAVNMLLTEKKEKSLVVLIDHLVGEAIKVHLTKEELIKRIQESDWERGRNNE